MFKFLIYAIACVLLIVALFYALSMIPGIPAGIIWIIILIIAAVAVVGIAKQTGNL